MAGPEPAHPATCTWCPLCRGVESLRSVDPAAVDRLTDAVAALAGALGELAGTLRERTADASSGHGPAARGGGAQAYDIPVVDEED